MSKLVLNLGIDVSGQPTEDVYVGLVSIKTDQINKIEKLFKNKFPKLYRGKQKGTKLKEEELKKIIQFLDENFVFMYCNYISNSDWFILKNQYKNKANFYERIYALLYFGIIHSFVFKHYPQNLVVCKEEYINTNATLKYLQYLAKSNDYTIIASIGYANSNFIIKLADLVAAAGRKIPNKNLTEFKKYKLLHLRELDHKFFDKIFEK